MIYRVLVNLLWFYHAQCQSDPWHYDCSKPARSSLTFAASSSLSSNFLSWAYAPPLRERLAHSIRTSISSEASPPPARLIWLILRIVSVHVATRSGRRPLSFCRQSDALLKHFN